jgi:uncharacterized protein (UPF0216 family)
MVYSAPTTIPSPGNRKHHLRERLTGAGAHRFKNPYRHGMCVVTFRPPVSDESVLMRWMALEMGKINDGVVALRRRLSELLSEDHPLSVTRNGSEFAFDREVIRTLGENLPQRLHPLLKLPVIFFFDSTVPDSCALTDEVALEAFQILGELSRFREFTGGKLWVGRAIVYAIMRKYPTAIQIMMT